MYKAEIFRRSPLIPYYEKHLKERKKKKSNHQNIVYLTSLMQYLFEKCYTYKYITYKRLENTVPL